MKAKDFDKKFDEGKNVVKHLDLSKAREICVDPTSVLTCSACLCHMSFQQYPFPRSIMYYCFGFT